jgi:outer membrane protein TolC
MIKRSAAFVAIICCTSLTGCLVGPDYRKPAAIVPVAYREAPPGWTHAAPADAIPKGDWWTLYNDPDLNRLEPLVALSNQTLAADYDAYRQAEEIVAETRGGLFPTLGVTGSATREGEGGGAGATATGSGFSLSTGPRTSGTFEGSADWTPDIWGKIRREVEGDAAAAQVSQADLASATLAAQATLASDYVDLRAADSQISLLRQTITADQRSLQITENQFNAGVAAPADVITARTQLAI